MDEFNKFFISVGETAVHSAANLASAYGFAMKEVTPRVFETSEDLLFQSVASSEVKKVIMQMPSNKAPGFNKVSISVIKDCPPHILPSITSLITSSFTKNTFPKAWKRSERESHFQKKETLNSLVTTGYVTTTCSFQSFRNDCTLSVYNLSGKNIVS